jgi:hypothetical protein
MKKTILCTLLCIVSFYCIAQKSEKNAKNDTNKTEAKKQNSANVSVDLSDQKYVIAIKAFIQQLNLANSIEGYENIANAFERVGNTKLNEWLPKYYIAYSWVMTAFMSKEAKEIDSRVATALQYIDAAAAITSNSEIECLRGMCHQASIMADPEARGQKYSQMAIEAFNLSAEMDPSNPRPELMKAQSVFYMPEEFGGGKARAKPMFESVLKKYSTFNPQNELMPNWGASMAKSQLALCSN